VIKYLALSIGIVLHILSYIILYNRIEPLYIFFYPLVWWSYILIMDAIYALKNKKFLILKHSLIFLIVISSGFWCIFELINLRIQNWFYINLPREINQRWILGYLLSYGTVIPAIYVTKEIIHSLMGEIKIKNMYIKNYAVYAITVGLFMFFITLLLPEYFFGLAWVSFGLIFDGYNYKVRNRSFAKDMEKGCIDNLLASMLGGLFCGILWEFWNNWAVTKWVYTVPFFEELKLFEMPVLGYVGFIAFGFETIAFLNFLEGLWSVTKKMMALTLMAFICFFTFPLIDRYTVFSYIAKIDEIDFIDKQKIETFKNKGIKTSFKIDVKSLDKYERDMLELMHLKGLGIINLKKLRQNNIKSVEELSTIDEETLSKIIDEQRKRRIRLFLKAAKIKKRPL